MKTRTLATLAVALVMATAGCGFLLGSEPLEFTASSVTVSDSAVSETGYEETAVTTENVTQNVTVADQRRSIKVVNHLAQYERQVELPVLGGSQRAAVFLALSSPQMEVAGQTLNPIKNLEEREMLRKFQTGYEGLSVGQQVDSRSVRMLGANRTLKKFNGTATFAGSEVDVYIHAAKFKHGSDFLAVVAIYPQELDDEEAAVVTLSEGLEHSTNGSDG